MGRERARAEELLSRFITTAMLPKLTKINKERKIVFLLATNYIAGFDAAFRRGGRFDMLVQIMPPNEAAKLAAWARLKEVLDKLDETKRVKSREHISDLTYDETRALVRRLDVIQGQEEIFDVIKKAWDTSTLMKVNIPAHMREEGSKEALTWKQTSEAERTYIQIPGM
jgi:SpoVK/Ycf46/Vps4 family AAA+-type ATPase